MDDDNLDQRLARIEALLPTLVTHDDLVRELGSVSTNINDLRTEMRTSNEAIRAELEAFRAQLATFPAHLETLHAELRANTATLRPLTAALSRWPDLFAGLTDRIRRLEDRE
jgi:chromosome segregation ATPase